METFLGNLPLGRSARTVRPSWPSWLSLQSRHNFHALATRPLGLGGPAELAEFTEFTKPGARFPDLIARSRKQSRFIKRRFIKRPQRSKAKLIYRLNDNAAHMDV